MENSLEIRWLGHSCFVLSREDFSLVTDPYADGSVPGLGKLRLTADAVFCSHGHHDHNFAGAVALSGRKAPADFRTEEFLCPHDHHGGSRRGMNTVRIFHFGPLRAAHLGDMGSLPSGALADALRGVDLLLLPVGGCYTIDAGEAAELIRRTEPRCAVPMHFRGPGFGFEEIGEAEPFLRALPGEPLRPGSSFTLTEREPRGLVLLEPALRL